MRRPFAIALLVAMLATAGIALRYRHNADAAEAHARTLSRELADAHHEGQLLRHRATAAEARVAELDSQLGSAKVRTTATETKSVELSRELSSVRSSLTERQQREIALLAEIEALRQQAAIVSSQRNATAQELPSPASAGTDAAPAVASVASSKSPSAAENYARRIAELETQLTELLARALDAPLTADDESPAPRLPPSEPAHQVVRVGANAAFVVIDYGTSHGAVPGQRVALARGTALLADAEISDVRTHFSIAQVLPFASKRQLQTGDIVLLAQ